MKNLKSWFGIVRPLNVVIAGIAVFIGAFLANGFLPLTNITLAIISAAIICAGGNILNDYFDVDIDRINKPARPIPSGKITKQQAFTIAIIFLSIGIVIPFFIAKEAVILACTVVVLLVLYNAVLKRNAGFIGNIVVSLVAAFTIVYGGIATGRLHRTFFPAIFAFLIHLGREITKDIEDISGDKKAKTRSIAITLGVKKSYVIGFIPILILIIITPFPYLFHIYNRFYLSIVIIFVDLPLLVSFFIFNKKLDTQNIHKLNNIFKLAMVFGLISLIIGSI